MPLKTPHSTNTGAMPWQSNPYHMHPYQRTDQDNQQQDINDKESNSHQDLHPSNHTTGLQPNTGMNERNGHGDSYCNGDQQQSQCLNLGMQKRDNDDQVKTQ